MKINMKVLKGGEVEDIQNLDCGNEGMGDEVVEIGEGVYKLFILYVKVMVLI